MTRDVEILELEGRAIRVVSSRGGIPIQWVDLNSVRSVAPCDQRAIEVGREAIVVLHVQSQAANLGRIANIERKPGVSRAVDSVHRGGEIGANEVRVRNGGSRALRCLV